MKRPGIEAVARAAGVSRATVDRVLHGRLPVSAETSAKVAAAAHRLGFHAAPQIDRARAAGGRALRFGFLLIKERQAFYRDFASQLSEAVAARADVRGSAEIAWCPSQSPEDFASLMTELATRCDVLACTAINHPKVTETVETLRAQGKAVFALLNDFAQGVRQNYIGLNNLSAGRVAGWMICLAARRPGKVALMLGSNRWHGHDLREAGFRAQFRETGAGLELLDSLVTLETRQIAYETTLSLLARHPTISGICVAGGGMEGVIAALRETRAPGDVAVVLNELTPESRAALAEGYATMAIATPLADLCRQLVAMMIPAAEHGPSAHHGQLFLEPRLILPASL